MSLYAATVFLVQTNDFFTNRREISCARTVDMRKIKFKLSESYAVYLIVDCSKYSSNGF